MVDLSLLNKEQRQAVTKIDGPLLILAGAGSGKTRVLTYRIAYLIEKGIYPGNILAITFTNKAAAEMKERVEKIVGEEAKKMWISTFHSSCVRMLRIDIDKLGYNKNFVIYDTSEQEKLIKECLKELNLDEKLYTPKDMLSKIGDQKDKLIDELTYYKRNSHDFKTKNIAEIYVRYQNKLKSNNALDFDDIIVKMVKLLTKENLAI
jgi:DNA helicase-2/ATP-dependent DNA helicase PcrA